MASLLLEAAEYGAGPPLAILHGLFGSGRNWGSIAKRLAERHRVIAFDLRNHGASPWAETMAYAEMAEDVRASLRGARISPLRAARAQHGREGRDAGRAVAIPARSSGSSSPISRRSPIGRGISAWFRQCAASTLPPIERRAEADAALASAVPDPAERGFLLQNLVIRGWRGAVADQSGGDRARDACSGRVSADTAGDGLWRAGAVYRRRAVRLSASRARTGDPASVSAGRIARIAEAGHWLHAERPQAFLDLVEPFLAG